MSFKCNSLYLADGYKTSHKAMLAPGTTRLYGTWIPRSTKYAPKGVDKIVSFGQQMTWKWIHDEFEENFFFSSKRDDMWTEAGDCQNDELKEKALRFVKDMSIYLGMEYDGKHFEELWDLGYLPIKVKALPEGIETATNIPHMTFVNTVDGFAWLTLYLETIVSSLSWKASTSATIALLYKRNVVKYVMETDPKNAFLIPFMCHDFSARGLSPFDMISSGLGHATSFLGSDTLPVIPASRYFYGVKEDEMPIFSVNASEHSCSTTKIFTVGEQQMIADWLKIFDKGILSIVSDTFDLWKLITEYLPANKEAIMARDGKLVIRPDSGDPVDIICGKSAWYENPNKSYEEWESNPMKWQLQHTGKRKPSKEEYKGVIELLWDIFGGTINEQGYKVLDPHIGAIYGDSITPERQVQIYERLKAKGFAATNIVLGVGSFTYQYNTRDTLGFAAKGAWFEVEEDIEDYDDDAPNGGFNKPHIIKKTYNIYKDPITDDGTKKSLKGLLMVYADGKEPDDNNPTWRVKIECTPEEENQGLLQVIYEDGKFYNTVNLSEIRERINKII